MPGGSRGSTAAADREEREQSRGDAERHSPQGGNAGYEHAGLEQSEASEATERVPVRGKPEDESEATQRSGDDRHRAWQPTGQR